jgi:Lipopolysaccharide-assembly
MWWSKVAKPCRSVNGPSRRSGHESRNRGWIKPACGAFAWSGVVLFVFLLAFGRCGYKVQPLGRPVGIDIQSLSIPLVESTSSLAGFEGDFTRMIRQEFVSHSSVPLVTREEAAMVLLGRIHTIRTDPLGYSLDVSKDYPVTSSRWLIMRLEAKLVDRRTGKTIWTEKNLEEKASYQVGQDPLLNRHNERRALEENARRLAKQIYLKTMERF